MIKPQEGRRPWTVTELAQQIQAALGPLRSVFVKGEVSGMKLSAKGHYTFTIRDSAAVIEAFIWGNDARRLPMLPEDGQEFIFRGRIEYWAQGGRVRLVVDYLEFDDVGKLRAQIELLKQRLEVEGAFAPERKRRLPFLPRAVALVTSPTGAVIHDLQQTIWDRFPNMEILVYPAQVQGAGSPGSVATALRAANRDGRAEVVVIARGGGSFEDLYGFNTEPVVRAILASRLPVVTALGHTSDRTLADMVSDAECRTPTEAGTRVVPRKSLLKADLAERERRIHREGLLRVQAGTEAVTRRRERLDLILPAHLQLRRRRLERAAGPPPPPGGAGGGARRPRPSEPGAAAGPAVGRARREGEAARGGGRAAAGRPPPRPRAQARDGAAGEAGRGALHGGETRARGPGEPPRCALAGGGAGPRLQHHRGRGVRARAARRLRHGDRPPPPGPPPPRQPGGAGRGAPPVNETPVEDLTYEQALEQFDARLRALEEGNLTLEEAIAAVAEGRRYLKICEAKLDLARKKIEVRPGTPGEPGPEIGPEPPVRDTLL